MESIARLVVASTELIEAEGRALKRTLGRLLVATGIGVVALVMVLAGIAFMMAGLFGFLARVIGWPGAALVFGVVAISMAAASAVKVKKLFS